MKKRNLKQSKMKHGKSFFGRRENEENLSEAMDSGNDGRQRVKNADRGIDRAVPIILFGGAVFIALCYVLDGVGTGEVGAFITDMMRGLFSFGAYLVPPILLVASIFYTTDLKAGRRFSRAFFSLLLLLIVSAFGYLFAGEAGLSYNEYFEMGKLMVGGGAVGSLLGMGIIRIFGKIGLIIIGLCILLMYVSFFLSKEKNAITVLGEKIFGKLIARYKEYREDVNAKKLEKQKQKRILKLAEKAEKERIKAELKAKNKKPKKRRSTVRRAVRRRHEELFRDDFIETDNGLSKLEIKGLSISEEKDASMFEKNPDLQQTIRRDNESFGSYADEFGEPIRRNHKTSDNDNFGNRYSDLYDGVNRGYTDSETIYQEGITSQRADDVFTKDFKPYDLELNARMAGRKSSKVTDVVSPEDEYVENLDDCYAEYEKQKRIQDFERRKAEALRKREYLESKRNVAFTEIAPENHEEHPKDETLKTVIEKPTYREFSHLSESTVSVFSDEDEPFSNENTEIKEEKLTVRRSAIRDLDEEEESFELPLENEKNEYSFSDKATDEPAFGIDDIDAEEETDEVNSYDKIKKVFDGKEDSPVGEDDKEMPSIYVAPEYKHYQYPPFDLLVSGRDEKDPYLEAEIQENANILIDTLASFNVNATIPHWDSGPRITRYEVLPARGVKVSAVTKLEANIVMNLAVEGIRMEAPIPGKNAIGFEIPKKRPQIVRLRDLIETDEFHYSKSKTNACIGKDVAGMPVFGDISKMPHLLVAGATGMGKSVCINAMLLSILFRARPDEVKLIMIDPKKVEFKGFNGIPHLLVPVVTDPKQAAGALMWVCDEMEKRFDLIEKVNVRKIDDYNAKVKADPSLGKPMCKIIVVIDELNDLMLQVRDPVENLIMRITQKARAAGIHLIIGTQRPSVDVITGVIKSNIPSRMSCKVSSAINSRTILEVGGAEKLLNNGDMLFWPVGNPAPIRVQSAFVSDDELDRMMAFLRTQATGHDVDEGILDEINRAASKCDKSRDDALSDDEFDVEENGGILNDQTFLDVVNIALNMGKVSTSLLQRKCSLGYGRAAKYIDAMEELGIVSEMNGQKPRDVLMTKQDFMEMLSRREIN